MDKHNWYYRFLADVDWLNSHHQDIDNTAWNLLLELTQDTGVVFGMESMERGAGPNFSVDINSGVGYDTFGRRLINNATANVPFLNDAVGNPIQVVAPGNEKIIAVYAYYHTTDQDPAIDGFGDTVYQFTEEDIEFKLYQGAEDAIGNAVPPPNPGDGGILLAYVTISFGDGTIENADIDTTVKEELKLHGDAAVIHNFGDEDIEGNKSFINGYDLIFYSDDGITETARIDGDTGNITTVGTVDGVDVGDHDHSGPNQGGTVDHGSLTSIGVNTHAQIDTHLADASIHFTEASIDHGNIQGLGDDDHPQYGHLSQNEVVNGQWTFAQPVIGQVPVAGNHLATKGYADTVHHGGLTGLGDNDHPQYPLKGSPETITGAWTFNQVVIGQNPVAGNHLATKSYVDGASVSDHGSLGGLGDDDHTQYLHLNKGGQTLQQSLAVAGGATVDGVNISTHTHNVSINLAVSRNDRANQNNNSSSDDTYTIGGYDSGDFAICAVTNLDLHNNNFSGDNHLRIGGTTIQQVGGFDWLPKPNYSGGLWNFRVMTGAGNDDQVAAFFYGVISDNTSVNTGSPN